MTVCIYIVLCIYRIIFGIYLQVHSNYQTYCKDLFRRMSLLIRFYFIFFICVGLMRSWRLAMVSWSPVEIWVLRSQLRRCSWLRRWWLVAATGLANQSSAPHRLGQTPYRSYSEPAQFSQHDLTVSLTDRCWRAWSRSPAPPVPRAATWPMPCSMEPTVSCWAERQQRVNTL